MKHIIFAILIIALVAAGWLYFFTDEREETDNFMPEAEPGISQPTAPPNTMAPPSEPPPGSGSTTTNETEDTVEPITIQVSQLPDGQQTVLRTLGIDGETITFTPEMVACAEAEIGTSRLDEIVAGDTPSLGEGATLVSCYRQ